MLDQPAIEDGEEEELFSRAVLKTQSLILSTSAVEIVWTWKTCLSNLISQAKRNVSDDDDIPVEEPNVMMVMMTIGHLSKLMNQAWAAW